MDNFKIFGLNLWKLPNYFVSNNVEGVAESWLEAEMSWVGVDGAEWSWVELGGAGWSWVELDGARWRWVHGLVVPISNRLFVFFNCLYCIVIHITCNMEIFKEAKKVIDPSETLYYMSF